MANLLHQAVLETGSDRVGDKNPEKNADTAWGDLLTRLQAGDRSAQTELLGLAHQRLRRLAAKILNDSFPALAHRHEVDSVVHEGCIRLIKAFDAGVAPAQAEDFFRFAAFKVRQVLLDLAERSTRLPQSPSGSADTPEPEQETYDPAVLAVWREFHECVNDLEEPERSVFALSHYLGMSQREIADALRIHPRTVSRVWMRATERLADVLPEPPES